jgi:tetratricopeptide (TPR) repeat protein
MKRLNGSISLTSFSLLIALLSVFSSGLIAGCKEERVGELGEAVEKEEKAIAELRAKIEKKQAELDKAEREKEGKTSSLAEKEKEKRDESIRKYEQFLGDYPISPYTPDVLVALGELYLERSEEDYVESLDEWQAKSETALAAGTIFNEPSPQPHYEKTIAAYQQITLKYKDYPFADVAFYGLGYCLQAQGEYQEAAETYYNLCKNYPDSKFVPEAYFRIGEYWFDTYEKDHYKKAISYYEKVPPETDFYDKALYKIGWAWYNMGDIGQSSLEYENAIDAFTKLIEESEQKSVLTDEAMEFSAISLTEWATNPDDETAITNALSNYDALFEGGKKRSYSPEILHQLGDVYLYKQDKLKAATLIYEALLTKYPDYEKAPTVLDSLVEAYLRNEDYEGAHETRVRVVDNYGPNSAWYQRQKDLDIRNEALKRWEKSLYEVAVYNHQKGENEPDSEKNKPFYEEAINRYNQYITAFPTNTKSYHVNFYLAQTYDAVGDWRNAGDQYQKTALGYTDEEHYEIAKWDERFTRKDALYNAVVAFDEIFREELSEAGKEGETETETQEEPIITADLTTRPPEKLPSKKLNLDEANLIRACDAFIDLYSTSPETPLVLSERGEVYFFIEDFDEARSSFERLISDYPIKPEGLPAEFTNDKYDELYIDAWEYIAKSYYREAEYYEKIGDAYMEIDPEFARLEYEKSIENYGLSKTARGRTYEAAIDRNRHDRAETNQKLKGYCGVKEGELMVKIGKSDVLIAEATLPEVTGAEVWPETETPPEYTGTTKLPDNVDVLGDLVIAEKDDITGAVNLEREEVSETEKTGLVDAAKVYEQNADDNQGTEVGMLSLGKAAETFDQANDYENAGRVYLKYAKAYPEAEDAPSAWKSSAEMYEYAGDYEKAAGIWLQITDDPKLKNIMLGEGEEALAFGEIALFQAAVCYELVEDWRNAGRTYDRFNDEYQEHAIPRVKATFRQGRAEEKLGNYDDAIEAYKECAGLYKYATINLGLEIEEALPYAAEATFKMTDIGFDEYDRIQLVMPQKVMEANLERRLDLSKNLVDGYSYCVDLGEPEWTVAAKVRMGDVNLSFKDALMNAEVPAEIEPSKWENLPEDDPTRMRLEQTYYNYVAALDEQALPLEDQAISFYGEALDIASTYGIENEWTRKAEEIMLRLRPYEVIKYEDVGTTGVRTAAGTGDVLNDWMVSNFEEPGWTTVEFDDMSWSSAQESYWKSKDEEETISTPPGSPSTIWGSYDDGAVYMRRKFSLAYMPEFELHVQARGQYQVYINGEYVGGSPAYKDAWKETQTFDPKPYLKVGDNVIAVYAERDKKDSYGVRLALRPSAGFPEEQAPVGEHGELGTEDFGELGTPGEEPGHVGEEAPESELGWMGEMEEFGETPTEEGTTESAIEGTGAETETTVPTETGGEEGTTEPVIEGSGTEIESETTVPAETGGEEGATEPVIEGSGTEIESETTVPAETGGEEGATEPSTEGTGTGTETGAEDTGEIDFSATGTEYGPGEESEEPADTEWFDDYDDVFEEGE